MSQTQQTIRLATRGSALAVTQAEIVAGRLRAVFPDIRVELVVVSTPADRAPEKPLREFGDKAVFVREVEKAVLEGRADAAVHSLKDVPAELAPSLTLAAIVEREDPRDVLISRLEAGTLDALPPEAIVATSSLRRRGQLLAYRPDLRIVDLRGNVDTRLRKLAEGHADAIILACAGLKRLGRLTSTMQVIDAEVLLPAPAQGAIGVEVLATSPHLPLFRAIENPPARVACEIERQVVQLLGADCRTPMGCLCECEGEKIRLRAAVCLPNGSRLIRVEKVGGAHEATKVASEAAKDLLALGAASLMDRARQWAPDGGHS